MAEFQIVPHVPADSLHPGGCFCCKVDQRRDPVSGALEPMISTNLYTDLSWDPNDPDAAAYAGIAQQGRTRIVLCRSFIVEVAHQLGFIPAASVDTLNGQVADLEDHIQQALDALEAAQIANKALLAERHEAAFGKAPVRRTPKAPAA